MLQVGWYLPAYPVAWQERGARKEYLLTKCEPIANGNSAMSTTVLDARLFNVQPGLALLALAADWGLIAAAFIVAIASPHPLTYLVTAIIIARTQLALAVMMHESAHGLLWHKRRLNDVLGQALTAGPLFLSLVSYRIGHLQHHLAPMTHDDPVAVVFGINDYPVPRWKLMLRLLSDLSGIGYLDNVLRMVRGEYRDVLPRTSKTFALRILETLSIVTINALLFGLLAFNGHAWLYLGLWLLPAITLLPFMGRIRAIMEHAGLPESVDQSQNARTIIRQSWQTFFFGPHAIHYHIEHHLYPNIPFYHLADAHQQLSEKCLLPLSNLYTGYGAILRDVSYRDS